MITIIFTDNGKAEYTLEVKGHANYGRKGKDIVCAAVSILYQTAAAVLEENKTMLKSLNYDQVKGDSTLTVTPKDEYQGNVQAIFITILTGFNLMATNYPHNVKLVIGERTENPS